PGALAGSRTRAAPGRECAETRRDHRSPRAPGPPAHLPVSDRAHTARPFDGPATTTDAPARPHRACRTEPEPRRSRSCLILLVAPGVARGPWDPPRRLTRDRGGDAAPSGTPSQACGRRPVKKSATRRDKLARRLLSCRLRRSAVAEDDQIDPPRRI